MMSLANKEVQPPRKGDPPLSDEEIAAMLPSLPGWRVIERESVPRLEKSFQFSNFKKSLDFANLVGEMAEEADHHPAILISWGRAVVSWWTFVVDGLHGNDFILAARTDQLYLDNYSSEEGEQK